MTELSVWLPWTGRSVRPGDVLSAAEARELLIEQRGESPFLVLPGEAGLHRSYVVALCTMPRTPAEVLDALLLGGHGLIVDELEAVGCLADEVGETVFIPIGGGQMVPRPYSEATPQNALAFMAWRDAVRRAN